MPLLTHMRVDPRHQANLGLERTQIVTSLFPQLALQNMNSWNPVLVYVLMLSPS